MGFPLNDAEHAEIKRQIETLPELVVAAAIRCGKIVVMVERPGRHGNCINWLNALKMPYMDQGFVTSQGRFVDREEAGKIVEAIGQGTTRENCNGYLFSEDMWNDWDITPKGEIDPSEIF